MRRKPDSTKPWLGTWQDRIAWALIFLGLVLLLLPKTTRLAIMMPLQTVFLAPLRGVRVLRTTVSGLENEKRRLSVLAAELAIENARLHSIARRGVLQPGAKTDLILAPVITRDLATFKRSLVVSRGTKHQVRLGAPALAPEGVVGRVVAVGRHQALVQTIFDPDSRIAVTNLRSRVPALARARGSRLLVLDYAPERSDFRIGDTIVTAGLGGVFPRGLRVGIVTYASDEPAELFKTVEVRPFADVTRLDQLFILKLPAKAHALRQDEWLDNIAPREIEIPGQP